MVKPKSTASVMSNIKSWGVTEWTNTTRLTLIAWTTNRRRGTFIIRFIRELTRESRLTLWKTQWQILPLQKFSIPTAVSLPPCLFRPMSTRPQSIMVVNVVV